LNKSNGIFLCLGVDGGAWNVVRDEGIGDGTLGNDERHKQCRSLSLMSFWFLSVILSIRAISVTKRDPIVSSRSSVWIH
jgi:hypothetical protein